MAARADVLFYNTNAYPLTLALSPWEREQEVLDLEVITSYSLSHGERVGVRG
jgi:hypothetical protein